MDKNNFHIFIDFSNDLEKMQDMLKAAEEDGFVMANDFNKTIPTARELYEEFKKNYHGNSKMILHFFYNNIINRKEISYGTRSVYKTYPQFKNIQILKV